VDGSIADSSADNAVPAYSLEEWKEEDYICLMFLSVYSIDFSILSEDGNYDHWHYSTRYEEFLLCLPYIRYFIDGHFNVKPAGGGTYIIQSTHNTCFLSGFFCCMYSGFIHVTCHAVGLVSICLSPKPCELNRFQRRLIWRAYIYQEKI
jgi:hypothetical protein